MVFLYRDHQDDGLLVSRNREAEWEEPCDACGCTDSLLGEFRCREDLAAFLEDGSGVMYSTRAIDQALFMAELLEAWEV